jgi:hypothetical protein
MAITHTFHVVPELPHGASIATFDEGGEIHTYVSLAAPVQERWSDLGWVFTHLAQCGDYARVCSDAG